MNLRTAVLARALPIAALVLAGLSAGAQPPPVRILPVGDSITYGSSVPGGYRRPLYGLLTNAGYSVDFTGTQTGNGVATLPDPDHEGHGGWRIDEIDDILLNVFAATADPDVILVLIGTNDYGQDYDETNAINRIDALIGKMATNRPFAKIVVANLLVRTGTNDAHIQNGFNAYLPGVVSNHAALGQQVYFDDLRSAVLLTDLADGVHPNATGYAKMATNWFAAITNVIRPLGTTNAPALARVRGQTNMVAAEVTFSKPVADSATNAALYALDGGVSVLAGSLSADKRVVTLTTSPQSPNTLYTLSATGVVDRTAAATPIATGANVTFLSQTPRGAFANVPEATNYTLMCSLDIPNTPNYQTVQPAYSVDQRSNAWPFTRTAYYLELQTATGTLQYVWVSLDALTTNALQVGVPTVAIGTTFRQILTNMNVACNVPGVSTGTAIATGNIEFWPSNYNQTNSLPVPGASSAYHDFGDNPQSGNHGSMQIHDHGAGGTGQTLFAFNRWGGAGGNADLGIGNRPGSLTSDWTFAQNANTYTIKTIQAFVDNANDTVPPILAGARAVAGWTSVVLSFSEPLAEAATNTAYYALSGGLSVLGATLDPVTKSFVTLTTTPQAPYTAYTVTVNSVTDRSPFANPVATDSTAVFVTERARGALVNVPGAADFTLAYSLDIPTMSALNHTNPLYAVDNHAFVSNFTRVAYYLELQTPTTMLDFVWTEMDPFTQDAAQIGVPIQGSGVLFQQPVTNLTVVTTVAGLTTGTNLAGGNMEFWCWDYDVTNSAAVPGASDTAFDWGDMPRTNVNGYGSMQIHNAAASQVLWAFNNWGGTGGGSNCLGIGNNTSTTASDWTHVKNAAGWVVKTLQVYVLPATNVPPALAKAEGAANRTQVVVTFTKPVADGAGTAANYALDGGLSVLGAELDPVTKTFVTLTTSPQTAGQTYTLTVTGIVDRTSFALPIAPGASTVFVAAPEPVSGVFTNIPEAADFTMVYSLDLPTSVNYGATNPAYSVDVHGLVTNFTRVAYYLELQPAAGPLQYVWAEMDPFTPDAGKLGMPRSGVWFQQRVTNLTVRSNVGGVLNGTNMAGGNIEFWPWNYSAPNAAAVPYASASAYDWGDTMATNSGNHGSLQIHNYGANQCVLAVNRFGGSVADVALGIGNNSGNGNPDWTFMDNAASYVVRRLQVFVLPSSNTPPAITMAAGLSDRARVVVSFSKPLADGADAIANFQLDGGLSVLAAELDPASKSLVTLTTTPQVPSKLYTVTVTGVVDRTPSALPIAPGASATFHGWAFSGVLNNIPEAAAWTMVYSIDLPAAANYGSTSPAYRVDNHYAVTDFSRVAYYLELQPSTGGPPQYAWAEMDPFTADAGKIGIPSAANGALFQQPVTNLTVRSNVDGVLNGTNMAGGNLEFWRWNYAPTNALEVTNASDTAHDWGDRCDTNNGNHGSMQIHNAAASHMVLGINRFGGSGGNMALGIGNNPSGVHPDWTLMDNSATFLTRRLQVFVLPSADTTPPSIASAVAPPTRDQITVTFSEPLADGAENLANYSLSGGLALLEASLSTNFREVVMTTGFQTPGVTYTVTVNNVRDRSASANLIAPTSTVVVAPYSFAAPERILANVPEAANYQLLQHLAIPTTSPGWNVGGTVYNTDYRRYFGPFTRVAYYLELATNAAEGVTNWIWVSMDPFTNDVNYLGVPDMAAGVRYQQMVSNLNILSSHPGIITGTGLNTGNIEFWGQNYSGANALSIPNATGTWDWGDVLGATFGTSGYGSMQVHNHGAGGTGQVLFAYNHWGDTGTVACVGIGNRPNHPTNDWTFADNGAQYPVKNLYVLILPPADTNAPVIARALPSANQTNILVRFDEPVVDAAVSNFTVSGGLTVDAAEFQENLRDVKLTVSPAMTEGLSYTVVASNIVDRSANANADAATATVTAVSLPVYTRVAEAAGFELAYHLAIPTISPNYNSNNIVYDLDYRPIHARAPFRRIAYYMELATSVGGTTNWIYTSMETTSTNINRIGVPLLGMGAGFQQKLTNLNVLSSVAGIVTSNGIQTGNLEFWPLNYGGATNTVIPTGTAGYDWNDTHSTAGQYGSMQVHNYAANGTGQVLWAFNRWGGNFTSGSNDVGIGTRPAAASMDWTQLQNAGTQVVKNLTILAMPTNIPPPMPPTPPSFAPTFALQPASQIGQLGGAATLTAQAGGTAVIAYQWRFNGTALPGETNSWLLLTGLALTNAGPYDAIAVNGLGAATSLTAALTVNRAPAVTNLAVTATQDVARVISRVALLAQAGDPDGDPLSILSAGPTSTNGGTVALGPTDVTYTPVPGFAGADRFSFVVDDSRGGLSTGVVVLTVISTAAPPIPMTAPPRVTGGNFTLSLTGTPGQVYAVQATSHLVTQTWSTVTNITAPTNGLFQFVEPATNRMRHYRTLSP